MTFSHRCHFPSTVISLGAVVLLFVALSLFLVACGGSSPTTLTSAASAGITGSSGTGAVTTSGAGGATVQVTMVNRTFNPATVTVKVGDTILWTNQDSMQHDVVADNGEFKSQLFNKDQTFSFTFTKAGTYPYYCSIHPGMTGTVIVQ
jgi:plastocyanin